MQDTPQGPRVPRGRVRVRGERRRSLMVIPALAEGENGRIAELELLIDSGAARTCLTPEAAIELGLDLDRPIGRRHLRGVGATTAPLVLLPALQVGKLIARSLPVAVLPLPEALTISGLIGLDFCDALGITRLTIELDTATLVLR